MTETAIQAYTDPDVAAAMQLTERLTPLQDALGLKDLTVPEMQLFAMVAHHTGLDPFTRQIYAIKRGGKVTHQTGIDGYRSTAERMTGQYAGSDEATYEACECGDEGSPREHPAVARVVVHRILANGHIVNQTGVARWHELKPEHKKSPNAYDFLDAMWWRMPYNQLAKCAEANGLRKAFPRVLGGVYIAEEMEQDRTIDGQATEQPARKTLAERAAERAAAITPTTPAEAMAKTPEEAAADVAVKRAARVAEEAPIEGEFTAEEIVEVVDHGPALCGWKLAAKGGAIVPCSNADGHDGDHSWDAIARSAGGRVVRPEA